MAIRFNLTFVAVLLCVVVARAEAAGAQAPASAASTASTASTARKTTADAAGVQGKLGAAPAKPQGGDSADPTQAIIPPLPFHPVYKPTEVQLSPEQVAGIQQRVKEQVEAYHVLMKERSIHEKAMSDLALAEKQFVLEESKSMAQSRATIGAAHAVLSVLGFIAAMGLVIVALLLTHKQLSRDATRFEWIVRAITNEQRNIEGRSKVAGERLLAAELAQEAAEAASKKVLALAERRAKADADVAAADDALKQLKTVNANLAPDMQDAKALQDAETKLNTATTTVNSAQDDERRALNISGTASKAAEAAREVATRALALVPTPQAGSAQNGQPSAAPPVASSDLVGGLAAVLAAMKSEEKLSLGPTGFTLGTQAVGVLMLVVTLGFFFLYMERIYPATILAGVHPPASAPAK